MLTQAMAHRIRYGTVKGSVMNGNTLVTKQKVSNVSDYMRLNMRDEMAHMVRPRNGLHDTRVNRKFKTLGFKSSKGVSVIHQRIEYKA